MSYVTRELANRIHLFNHKWWHDREGNRLERNKGELICLFHSEVSEGSEGFFTDAMDDKLPHHPMIAVEMADTKIRIADYSAGFGHDLETAETRLLDALGTFDPAEWSELEIHAIIHLHLSKAMECERKGRTFEVAGWLNGALSIIHDYCADREWDLDGIMEEKLAFNLTREDHTYEARERADGKKW